MRGGRSHGFTFALQALQMRKTLPRHLAAAILPHALNRIAFGAPGGQEDERDVLGRAQRFGGMGATPIQHNDGEGVLMAFGNAIKEDLHVRRIEFRQQLDVGFARGRCHTAETPAIGILMLDRPHRLDPTDGNAAPAHRHQAPPAFVVAPDPHRTCVGRRYRLVGLIRQRGFERRVSIRVFYMLGAHHLRAGLQRAVHIIGNRRVAHLNAVLRRQPDPYLFMGCHPVRLAQPLTEVVQHCRGHVGCFAGRGPDRQQCAQSAICIQPQPVADRFAVYAQAWRQRRPGPRLVTGNQDSICNRCRFCPYRSRCIRAFSSCADS